MSLIKRFGHSFQEKSPGSRWHPYQSPLMERHKALVVTMFYPDQYHVVVKYAYAQALLFQKDIPFWRGIYEKMQTRRCGRVMHYEFESLLRSIKTNSYNDNFPIPVSYPSYEILDGSHRLGICLALDLWPTVEVYNSKPHSYNREWFIQNGFSDRELRYIDQQQNFLLHKLGNDKKTFRVGIVWGNALGYWEEILQVFRKHNLKIGRWVNLKNKVKTEQFIIESYMGDGMKEKYIKEKAYKLAQISTLVGIFVIEEKSEEAVRETKKRVREIIAPKLEHYFFDSILHIIDSPTIAQKILNQYLSSRKEE